jgi:DNA-binding response OmpR family regulator
MSNANAAAPAASVYVGSALVVSNDAAAINHISVSMQQLAMSPEVCFEVSAAQGLLNRRKFEAVIVDLQLGDQAKAVLEKIRLSPANRTAVLFTISDSDSETAVAFKAGSNFVLRRPLSQAEVDRSLRVAYGLIVRERRRYFRCPVEVPAVISQPDQPEVRGQTLNISEGGIAITTSAKLQTGAKVQVQFTLPGRKSPFTVESTICWCKEGYLGLQFTAPPPQLLSDLQEWLSRRLEESLPESVVGKFRGLEESRHSMQEPAASRSAAREPRRDSSPTIESQDWVVLYRAAVSEADVEKRLPKIQLAEGSMKRRWSELTDGAPESAEERKRLSAAIENLRGLRAGGL